MKKIYPWEPWFFIFFGLFHLHRIWALVDRSSYAAFWIGLMENKGALYYLIMGLLTCLCIMGIVTFIREYKTNYSWRWIYLFGGVYVLFDLAAIAYNLEIWRRFLAIMFDTASPYWNAVWLFFILLGAVIFVLGVRLLSLRQKKSTK